MSWAADIPWFRVLAEYLIKSTLVISLGLVLVRLLRRRTASLRHFVLFLFLTGLLFLPLLSLLPAGWKTSLLPAWPEGRSRSPAPIFAPADPIESGTWALQTEETRQEPGPAVSYGDPAGSAALTNERASADFHMRSGAIPAVWLTVLSLLLLRLATGLARAALLTRKSEPVDEPAWRVLLARCLTAVRLRRRVRLMSHPEVVVPLTWGVRKPVVLIPPGHREWTDEQGSTALVHELCHVKRADFLALLLVRLSLAVFWFNPLCWLALRRLKKEQEKACDELVLRAGLRPSAYAAGLLFFKRAAAARWPASVALVGITGGNPFQDRLASILRSTQILTEVTMKMKLALALSTILAVGLVGLARPSTAAAEAVSAAALTAPEEAGTAFLPAEAVTQETAGFAQEKKAETQEKEKQEAQEKKEEKEKKAEKVRTIVLEPREGKKLPLAITITQGDEVKKLKIGTSVTIKKDAGGDVLIVTAGGEELKLDKGKPFRLEIEGGALKFIDEGKAVKADEGGVVRVITEKSQGDTVTYHVVRPAGKVLKVEKGEAEGATSYVMVGGKGKPAFAWTVQKGLTPVKEKLRALREKLKGAKDEKLALQEVEEALADLEADLEKETEEPEAGLDIVTEKGKVDVWVMPSEEGVKKDAITVTVSDKTGELSLVYTMLVGEKKREVYDRIVERVKKELPEGYTLDPSFAEDTGAVTLKITGPPGQENVKGIVKKLGDIVKEEIEQAKK